MLNEPTLLQLDLLIKLYAAAVATQFAVPVPLTRQEEALTPGLNQVGYVSTSAGKYQLTPAGRVFLEETVPHAVHAIRAHQYWWGCAARRSSLLRTLLESLHTLLQSPLNIPDWQVNHIAQTVAQAQHEIG